MLNYVISTDQVKRILRLLSSVVDVRMAFFDMDGRKLGVFDVRPDSGYCSRLRQSARFNALCEACDREHLLKARDSHSPLVYRCHNNLTEAVVPLFDDGGQYLGAIVLGQIRVAGEQPGRAHGRQLRLLYEALPAYSERQVRDIADLLTYIALYMIQNHLVQHRGSSWVERIREHVRSDPSRRLDLGSLAAVAGCSVSQVSHRFRHETGASAARFVRDERMRRAREMLTAGRRVKEVAYSLGFCDEFHFSKAFRREHGLSPSTWTRDKLSGPSLRRRRDIQG